MTRRVPTVACTATKPTASSAEMDVTNGWGTVLDQSALCADSTPFRKRAHHRNVSQQFLSLDGVAEDPATGSSTTVQSCSEHRADLETQTDVLLGRVRRLLGRLLPTADSSIPTFITHPDSRSTRASDRPWKDSVRISAGCRYLLDLKHRSGGDIGIHGSTSLALSLIAARLVDELLLVMPPRSPATGARLFSADATWTSSRRPPRRNKSPKDTLFLHTESRPRSDQPVLLPTLRSSRLPLRSAEGSTREDAFIRCLSSSIRLAFAASRFP